MGTIKTNDVIISVVLILFSGLFSGLNLGLLSLDTNGLKIVIKSGEGKDSTQNEKKLAKYAKVILPVREHGNWLLCTLLLSNVAVNSFLAITMAQISSGMVGFLLSTILIVIFGEIIPQSYCTKYGLFVGCYSIWPVKILMILTGILSWPTGKMLDYTVGKNFGIFYSRNQLKNSVEYSDAKDYKKMIGDAIDFPIKNVRVAMKKWEKVYKLEIDDVLTFDTLCKIWKSGYSRIPVYEKVDTKIVGLLYTKELILLGLNRNETIPIRVVIMEHSITIPRVSPDVKLHKMLDTFQTGNFSHLALVIEHDILIGIVTLEDVIEELLQEEIIDENDIEAQVERDKSIKRIPKSFLQYMVDINSQPSRQNKDEMNVVSDFLAGKYPNLFGKDIMTYSDLVRFVNKCSIIRSDSAENNLYVNKEESGYMCLILEGEVEIIVGYEGFKLIKNTWSTFGSSALNDTFVPDYSMKFLETFSRILVITKDNYINHIDSLK